MEQRVWNSVSNSYTRPVWVECYPEFCTHGRAHVSVGDLKRRFVSSDLCTLLAYWFVVFTFHSFFVFGVSTNLLVFNFKASELLNQIEEGETYFVSGYGKRIPMLGLYPKIKNLFDRRFTTPKLISFFCKEHDN